MPAILAPIFFALQIPFGIILLAARSFVIKIEIDTQWFIFALHVFFSCIVFLVLLAAIFG